MDHLYYFLTLATFLIYPAGYAGWLMPVVLLAIIGEAVTGRFRWRPTSLDRPLVVLLAVALASAVASSWRPQSLIAAILFALMVPVSIYPAARVIRDRPAAIRPIAGAWVIGGVLAAAWGIMRAQATWPSGASTPALLSTALGTTLAAAIILALGAWTIWDRRWIRVGLIAGLPVLVTALQLTTSRASWIAATVGVAVMIGMAPRRRIALVALCAVSLAIATLATRTQHAWLEQRLESIPSLEANEDRVALWRGALRMVRDHPVLGTGYGTFVLAWPHYEPDPRFEGKPTAHNVFLNFAAETGLAGLAAYLVLLAVALAGLWRRVRSSRRDPSTDGLWVALFAAVVAIMIQQLFDGTVLSWHMGYGLLASFALAAGRPSGSFAAYENTPD